jgi:peptidoglycan/xylan/chitin deacetylase (PgdA/CDA1 family)
VEHYQKKGIRGNLRHAALDFFSIYDRMSGSFDESFKIPRVQFLYIHHLFNDEENNFRQLLEFLLRDHVFITYSEGIRRVLENDIDKPYIVFSSDDGFKNNLTFASILKEYGASGCFFVCPSIVGETDFEKVKKFCSERLNFPPVEFMDWDDIDQLASDGHEIGGHTMSHVDLGGTGIQHYNFEIAECFTVLHRKFSKDLHFAFPYGRMENFNIDAHQYVMNVGFKSVATAIRGCYFPDYMKDGSGLVMFNRDHMILKWPLGHIKHFLYRNIKGIKTDSR